MAVNPRSPRSLFQAASRRVWASTNTGVFAPVLPLNSDAVRLPGTSVVRRASLKTEERPGVAVYLLLPLVFTIHDGEELFTTAAWLGAHRTELQALSESSLLARAILARLPTSLAEVAAAIAAVFVVLLVVTLAAGRSRQRGFWLYAYATLLGLLFLHVFTHTAQAVYFRGYVPGLVGALVAVLPGTLYIYKRLLGSRLLTWKAAILTALLGIALFIPGALTAFALARNVAFCKTAPDCSGQQLEARPSAVGELMSSRASG
jgi:hypothetical protein